MPNPVRQVIRAVAEPLPAIAVVGAGAVGCYFGGMFARAGSPVTLIGRGSHVQAIQRDGLFLDGIHVRERIPVAASTEISAVIGASIVLFCVKTLDTETAAVSLAPFLAPGALVVSLQNGVENAQRIRAAAGIHALPAVVFVGAQMEGPGHVKHTGRGDLAVGWPNASSSGRPGELSPASAPAISMQDFAGLAERSGIPCRITGEIETVLWTKLIMNCAYNAISALGRANYGQMLGLPECHRLMEEVVREAAAVAAADGILLPELSLSRTVFGLGEGAPTVVSSTAQDIARGKRTEIDDLNGFVVRRADALGIPVPVNRALLALVKLLEPPPPGV